MPRRNSEAFQERSPELDDELGLLIQRSLEDSVQGKEPGSDVWLRIRQRVEENDLRPVTDGAGRGSSSPLVRFVQAVVVSTLLLTFVFGANHDMVMPHGAHLAVETPAVKQAYSAVLFEDDVLQGYKLVRLEKEMLARRGGHIQGTRALR